MLSPKMTERLAVLGENLKLARKRRGKNEEQAAEMIGISRATLRRMEEGDPGVRMGTYLAALESYQLEDGLRFAEPEDDVIGLSHEKQRLPKRIRPIIEKKYDF